MEPVTSLTKSVLWNTLHSEEYSHQNNHTQSGLNLFRDAVLQIIETNLDEYIRDPDTKLRMILSDGVYMTNMMIVKEAKEKLDLYKRTGMLKANTVIRANGCLHKGQIFLLIDYEIVRDDVLVPIGSPVMIGQVEER
jgi:hypothetical protein